MPRKRTDYGEWIALMRAGARGGASRSDVLNAGREAGMGIRNSTFFRAAEPIWRAAEATAARPALDPRRVPPSELFVETPYELQRPKYLYQVTASLVDAETGAVREQSIYVGSSRRLAVRTIEDRALSSFAASNERYRDRVESVDFDYTFVRA